ncbi:MAG TPA: DoxX family protein [Gemmatimonadales bacterium]
MSPTARRRTGNILSGLAILFLLADSFGKLVKAQAVIEGTLKLGYPESSIVPIGIILLVCVIFYAIPRTAVLGAILLTGYLGGAVATNLRVGAPLLLYILFPIYVAGLVWGGIYLREDRLRQVLPIRR